MSFENLTTVFIFLLLYIIFWKFSEIIVVFFVSFEFQNKMMKRGISEMGEMTPGIQIIKKNLSFVWNRQDLNRYAKFCKSFQEKSCQISPEHHNHPQYNRLSNWVKKKSLWHKKPLPKFDKCLLNHSSSNFDPLVSNTIQLMTKRHDS